MFWSHGPHSGQTDRRVKQAGNFKTHDMPSSLRLRPYVSRSDALHFSGAAPTACPKRPCDGGYNGALVGCALSVFEPGLGLWANLATQLGSPGCKGGHVGQGARCEFAMKSQYLRLGRIASRELQLVGQVGKLAPMSTQRFSALVNSNSLMSCG